MLVVLDVTEFVRIKESYYEKKITTHKLYYWQILQKYQKCKCLFCRKKLYGSVLVLQIFKI